MARLLDKFPWLIVLALCATLGLAPVTPEPHIWEKLKMLVAGDLVRAIDWFDLLLHSLPWALALAKVGRQISQKTR